VVRKSTDGGVTFPTILTAASGFCGDQCYYDEPVAMPMTNPNSILLGGSADDVAATCPSHILTRSTDGGTNIRTIRGRTAR